MSEDRHASERTRERIAVENLPSADDGGEDRAILKPAKGPHLRVLSLERTVLVRFVDAEILFEEAAVQSVSDQLDQLVGEQVHTRFLLNFDRVRYLSGSVLARLARLQNQADRVHGRIDLCRLDPLLQDMLRICHMDKIFDVYADEAEALGLIIY
jgi:anti-anti-sigma factor